MESKLILDACCSGRAFWFDKHHPNALYVDKRNIGKYTTGEGKDLRTRECAPDMVMDFRKLDLLADESFRLVVFDPPHLFVGENSYMGKIYGSLDRSTWKEDLTAGFSECFRVLKKEGILIFKWNESDILLKDILVLTPHKPLFGHPSGKAQKTHWITFMKF